MARIEIHGRTLAGLAAAARLAKVGHQITLIGTDDPGDRLLPIWLLPAPWRDLLRKSGRAFDAELIRHGLSLVEAPPAEHVFGDGRTLSLPGERGGQTQAITAAFGSDAAARWTTLLDEVDQVWQAWRQAGIERPWHQPDRTRKAELWGNRTMADLVDRVDEPHLGELLLGCAVRAGAAHPDRAPAMLATRLSVERTFGRWYLSEHGRACDPRRMLDVMTERLGQREVHCVELPTDLTSGESVTKAQVSLETCVPAPPSGPLARLLGRHAGGPARGPTWAMAPAITRSAAAGAPASAGVHEIVSYRGGVPVIRYLLPDQVVEVDHGSAAEDPAWGWTIDSYAQWVARPRLATDDPTRWRASAASHAGNEAWAEVLSAALVSYQIHEHLTGEDIRPTNKAGRARSR